MAQRLMRCPCGTGFKVPEMIQGVVSCPGCGQDVRVGAGPDLRPVQIHIDEPVRALTPPKSYTPLIILAAAGVLVAASLLTLVVVFHDREADRGPLYEIATPRRPAAPERPAEPPAPVPETPQPPPAEPITDRPDPFARPAELPPVPTLSPEKIHATAPPPAPAVPQESALPAGLGDEVKQRVAALHASYRSRIAPADAERMRRILAAGKGTPEDLGFLRARVLEQICLPAETEYAGFQTKVRELEFALASTVAVDTVHFKDGRKIQGQVEEETDDYVRIKSRFGAVRTPRGDISRIERGAGPLAEFQKRYAASRAKPADLASLLPWCRDQGLAQARELAAYALLLHDPLREDAWAALGLARATDVPPAAGADRDVLHLRDGSRREGILASETEAAFTMEVVLRGSKGETLGTGKASIPKSDVVRVERMADAARAGARARLAAFGDRSRRHAEALARISLVPDVLGDHPAFRSAGTHFELISSCSEPLVRETVYTLEEMFAAYRRHFSVRRNAGRRITVYFFSGREGYDAFQTRTRGRAVPNAAYFNTVTNQIVAYNRVQSQDALRIRQDILDAEQQIEQYKKGLAAEEDRIEKLCRDFRRQTNEIAAALKRQRAGNPQAQAEIERERQKWLDQIKTAERNADLELAAYRKRANQAIEHNQGVIRRNQEILALQSREMYEILFHEAFHAFAANFLWEEVDNGGLPRWLHEGMATYYERSVVEAGELVHGGVHPDFLILLRGVQRSRSLMPLSTIVGAGAELFRIEHSGDVIRSNAAYAHAWSVAHYLLSRGITPEQVDAYVAEVSGGGDRAAAFEKLAGGRIPDVEAAWRLHLERLK